MVVEEEEDLSDLTEEELKERQDKKDALTAKQEGNAHYKKRKVTIQHMRTHACTHTHTVDPTICHQHQRTHTQTLTLTLTYKQTHTVLESPGVPRAHSNTHTHTHTHFRV